MPVPTDPASIHSGNPADPASSLPYNPLSIARILPPSKTLFSGRSARFKELAQLPSCKAKPWFETLSELSSCQQNCQQDWLVREKPGFLPEAGQAHTPDASRFAPHWKKAYQELYARMQPLLARLGEGCQISGILPEAAQEERATSCLLWAAGESLPPLRDAHDLLIAAALQLVWSAAARHILSGKTLDETALCHASPSVCPVCQAAPVGGVILSGEGKEGLRYLECSLCATRWHKVRARCTLCDTDESINYLGEEAGNPAIQAEACGHCQNYIKIYYQTRDMRLDPVADDLFSLALDAAVGEAGYMRGISNLYLGQQAVLKT